MLKKIYLLLSLFLLKNSGMQAQAILPDQLPNLILWLRADSVVKDGSNRVSSWVNVAGGANFDQPTTSRQPVWTNNVWNGSSAIRFDGTDDFLNAGDAYDMGTSSKTIFFVGRSNAAAYTYFAKGPAVGTASRFYLFNTGASNSGLFAYYDIASYGVTGSSVPAGMNIWSIVVDRDLQVLNLYKNGVLQGSTVTGIQGAGYDFNTTYRFLIGAVGATIDDSTQTRHLNGYVAEMLIYNSALSDTNRYSIEEYLRFKYARQINLGADIDTVYRCDTSLNIGAGFRNIKWYADFYPNVIGTSQNLTVRKSGTYWVTAIDSFGYETSDTIYVNVPYHGTSVEKSIICLGDSAKLTQLIEPTIDYHYVWRNLRTAANLPDDTNSIYVKTEGRYSCTITSLSGCILRADTVFVDVDSFQLFSLLPFTDTVVCGGNDIAVRPYQYPYISYLWQTPIISSTLQNVIVDTSGFYYVTVVDSNQCASSDSVYVTKNWDAPLTDFTASNICLGDSFTFSHNISPVFPDNIYSWSWTFGDGGSDTAQIPTYLYSVTGDYQVTLLLQTDSGCSSVKTKNVSIFPKPFAGYAYSPLIVCAESEIYFTDQTQLSFGVWQPVWIFNNTNTSTLSNPIYAFPDSGKIPFALIVTSDRGCTDTLFDSIEVHPPLIAGFSFENVCLGSATVFTDTSLFSSPITSHQWDFGNNYFSSLQNPEHTYASSGVYQVKLIITNDIGCMDTAAKDIKIADVPVALFSDSNTCEGFYYTPQDYSTFTNDSIIAWNWTIDTSTYNNIQSPQHLFPDNGLYPVTLSVTSESGCENSIMRQVSINPNPVSLFGFAPLYGEAPLEITFSNHSTNAAFYQWNFGDGTTSSLKNPAHTYLQDSTYHVFLTVFSDSGCTHSSSKTLTVAPTELDLLVNVVNVQQTILANGYVSVKITVTMSNIGTRTITSVKLFAILGGGSVIAEDWNDILIPGSYAQYEFISSFIVSAEDANSYVCVTAESVNGGETELRTDNNLACATLNGAIQLIGPLPNPASNHAVLGVILPKAGKVQITMVSVSGQYVEEETEFSFHAGRNDYVIPVHKLNAAEYFIRVKYNDDVFVRKLIVK